MRVSLIGVELRGLVEEEVFGMYFCNDLIDWFEKIFVKLIYVKDYFNDFKTIKLNKMLEFSLIFSAAFQNLSLRK